MMGSRPMLLRAARADDPKVALRRTCTRHVTERVGARRADPVAGRAAADKAARKEVNTAWDAIGWIRRAFRQTRSEKGEGTMRSHERIKNLEFLTE